MEMLVSTRWLAEHLDDSDLRILECTVNLIPGEDGGFVAEPTLEAWEQGHIAGSVYADLTNDLSDPDSPLRFTMPSPERFAEGMERLGVGEGTRVVLYDRRFTMWATRVWWMLRSMGFDSAAVLDGGWKAWTSEGRPVATGPAPERPPVNFVPNPRPELIANVDEVLSAMEGDTCIVNALSPDNHDGSDATYGRRGHIPGATNVYAVSLVDSDTHCYLPLAQLRSVFDDAVGSEVDRRIITYCGGGIAATSDAFILSLLGHDNVAVYDGSLSEWASDPARPLEV